MPLDEANDLLTGSGLPPAIKGSEAFSEIGGSITLTVNDGHKLQQRDIKTGEPRFWADGTPMMQLAIVGVVDGEERTLYAKGQMLDAIREAIQAAGESGLTAGGTLTVTLTEFRDTGKPSPMKVYAAKWEPPARSVSLDDF